MNMHGYSVASADLDDVSRNDKLGGFSVALFVRRTLCTQPKDPLHLVLETLLAWLFIHGPAWKGDAQHRRGTGSCLSQNQTQSESHLFFPLEAY